MAIKEIQWADWKKEVLEKAVVVVDVFGDNCSWCDKMLVPLEHVANETPVVKINQKAKVGDHFEQSEVSKQYNVRSTPTLLLFKNGEYQGRIEGLPLPDSTVTEQVTFIKEGVANGFVRKGQLKPVSTDFKKLSTNDLKVLAYDKSVALSNLQNELRDINNEIRGRG